MLCLLQTELCRTWSATGQCRYGGKCQFAHGFHELRPVQRHPKYKTEVGSAFKVPSKGAFRVPSKFASACQNFTDTRHCHIWLYDMILHDGCRDRPSLLKHAASHS